MRNIALNSGHREALAPATVGFRLDESARSILGRRAAALGISAHDLARHYVLEALHSDEERAALRDAIVRLHQEIVESRKDIANA
jgi:hypothetical protein